MYLYSQNFCSFNFTEKLGHGFTKVWGVAFVPSKRFIFNIFDGTVPAFVYCLELGESTFRGTDLLALVENQ